MSSFKVGAGVPDRPVKSPYALLGVGDGSKPPCEIFIKLCGDTYDFMPFVRVRGTSRTPSPTDVAYVSVWL